MTTIRKSHQPFVSKAPFWQRGVRLGVSISAICLLLTASVANVHASSLGNAVTHAVLNKISSGKVVQLVSNPLAAARQMVIVPEPSSTALAGLSGLAGFAGWRLRRRSGQKTNS
jgi:MYXO-CTERM domain-containing protein